MWFVVLGDGEGSSAAARAVHAMAPRVVEHPSGRPWLMGRWPDGMLRTAVAGDAAVAVIGDCLVTAERLDAVLARAGSVDEVVSALAGLPGSFHLVASVGGRVRVQGTLAAVRRVFHTRVDGVEVAGDRPDVLARLAGAGWDADWLALRLTGFTLYPLEESNPWRGVPSVPADHCLYLEPDGRAAVRRRWRAPHAELPLPEGAARVRRALADAVTCRAGVPMSTDLSGGMDSTSLAFLAARHAPELVTYRWAEHDAGNDDATFAALAAGLLPSARHVVDPVEGGVAMYAGLGDDAGEETDQPFGLPRSRARFRHIARLMAAEGSRLHLGGHGGDELFRPGGQAHVHDLMRRRPLTGLRQARDYRAMARCSWPTALRALLDPWGPAREIARAAESLTAPPPPEPDGLDVSWTVPMRMPPWATPEAVAAARTKLLRAEAAPLAAGREQHRVLLYARVCGIITGQAERLTAEVGARLSCPYLDDAVLEAALAVRPEARITPRRYKPLLVEAMRDLLPPQIADRTTKGEFSADVYHGLRRHRAELLELFRDSRLARHGLIDAAAVRETLLRPHTNARTLVPLDATLACERWLRALDAASAGHETEEIAT